MYEVLGAVWLSDSEEYRAKLVKEALKRGSGEEKQRYLQMQQQKETIFGRLQELSAAQQVLNIEGERNVCPQAPNASGAPEKNIRPLGLPSTNPPTHSRQAEADYAAKRQQYIAALKGFRAQNSALLSERLKLTNEYLALHAEYMAIEEAEKWLLLSMAIKNQSSLLGYMQDDQEK